jgi:hypothetical protein
MPAWQRRLRLPVMPNTAANQSGSSFGLPQMHFFSIRHNRKPFPVSGPVVDAAKQAKDFSLRTARSIVCVAACIGISPAPERMPQRWF